MVKLTPAIETTIPQRPDDLSDHAHRQLIGYVGLVLPFLLIAIALLRDGVDRWRSLTSISAYYYTGGAAAFVGMLISLALFLFTYRGYRNEHHWADRAAAITAAVAALGVAFFPTVSPDGVEALAWWLPVTGVLHHISAVVLFTMFAVFALWLFRKIPRGQRPSRDKQWRNHAFLACGLLIVGSMIWAGIEGRRGRPIFLPESVALVAFALSWLIKGYAFKTIASTARGLFGRRRPETV
jgi:hypothetical protein